MESYVPYYEIVRLVGEDAALILSKEVGGTSIYVASQERLRENSPIVRLIGMNAALALAKEFGGNRITVPSGPGRRALIWELKEAGWSAPRIARKLKLTERTIWRILSQQKETRLLDRTKGADSHEKRSDAIDGQSPRESAMGAPG